MNGEEFEGEGRSAGGSVYPLRDPVQIFSDPRVDSWVSWLSTSSAEGRDSDDGEALLLVQQHQRPSGVTPTGVLVSLQAPGTEIVVRKCNAGSLERLLARVQGLDRDARVLKRGT